MRLDTVEREALKYALLDFNGEIYLFGSRVDDKRRGGDIDILLIPEILENSLELTVKVESKFFMKCEQKIDVTIYLKGDLFCEEIIKNAERIDIKRI